MGSQRTRLVPQLGGTAEVHCLHGRQKRQVNTETDVAILGMTLGIAYDPKQHTILKCICCENLFVTDDRDNLRCDPCQGTKEGRAH